MKIPIKYGLLIAICVMAWVLIAHTLVPDPRSVIHTWGATIFFNVVQFIMIFLGLKALEREKGDLLTFKEGLKSGVLISLVYGLVASLFFAGVLAVVGTKWLANAPPGQSAAQIAAGAFAGLFITAMVLGLIYSTLISFFLAKRASA